MALISCNKAAIDAQAIIATEDCCCAIQSTVTYMEQAGFIVGSPDFDRLPQDQKEKFVAAVGELEKQLTDSLNRGVSGPCAKFNADMRRLFGTL